MKRGIKFLPKRLLIEFNNAAKREKRNQYIEPSILASCPDGYNFPIEYLMIHNVVDEVRTRVYLGPEIGFALLDMSRDRFSTIPIAVRDQNGDIKFPTESEIRKKMPYNGKEWIETKYKKVYRGNQKAFRKKVLAAYENQCAVCGQSNPIFLRAAHIKDAAKGGEEVIENGICLCTNHEIAFDRGDLKICEDGTILLNYEDSSINREKIRLPIQQKEWPSKELLKWKFDKIKN
ncbi:HNH endonuclease [Bacillus cereus]|uniref:HNH endonuclease n=1 Tax=Bacillus cereus TaxID=1396 RepID=UPI000BEE5E8E|nr:HNH endonuclease [Bacillus cereus]MED2489840.1 HNH endonuclease [Bacillus thuringiensis]PED84754.1 HNH endonuclease [Bacillus cereus]